MDPDSEVGEAALCGENNRLRRRVAQLEAQLKQQASASVDSLAEASYRALLDNACVCLGINRITPEGRPGKYVDVNECACQMFGYSREEFVALDPTDLHPPETKGALEKAFKELLSRGHTRFESVGFRKDGSRFPVAVCVHLDEIDGAKLALAVVRDISLEKQAEKTLRESEAHFRVLAESSPVGIFLFQDEKFSYVNPKLSELFGYPLEEMVDRLGPGDLTHPEDFAEHQKSTLPLRVGETTLPPLSFRGVRKDGSSFPCEVVACGIELAGGVGVIGTLLDISERMRLAARTQQAQRLESLGVLAGGIAHDFNNYLMAMLGNAELALLDLDPHSATRSYLAGIEIAAGRAAELCQQMLAYSGQTEVTPRPMDLSRLVQEMARMVEISISKQIQVDLDLASALPFILGDPTQLRQVVMNLLVNASEAIDKSEGTIAIRTLVLDCDGAFLARSVLGDGLAAGRYVVLEVEDDGCGMDEETKARVFDPFFSTKFTGRGMGMAAVHGIVRSHSGTIFVDSEPGHGSKLRIMLPVPSRKEIAVSPASPIDRQFSGKILLVDDEAHVIAVGQQMLERLGFSVLTARGAREALALYEEEGEGISCVILDYSMPHMDGAACFGALQERCPDVRVILSSGYNEEQAVEGLVDRGLSGFIAKPYRLADLAQTLHDVLSKP